MGFVLEIHDQVLRVAIGGHPHIGAGSESFQDNLLPACSPFQSDVG